MEGTQTLIIGTCLFEGHEFTHHVDYVGSVHHALYGCSVYHANVIMWLCANELMS